MISRWRGVDILVTMSDDLFPRREIPRHLGVIQTTDGIELNVLMATYPNGRMAIYTTKGGAPWYRISVNVPDANIEPDHFLAKTEDENEAIRGPLLDSGLFEDTGLRLELGFRRLELWRLVQAPAFVEKANVTLH